MVGKAEQLAKGSNPRFVVTSLSKEDYDARALYELDFSSIACVLLSSMRRIGLAKTKLQRAQCSTIRLKLLKVGALVRITCRKIWISFSSSYPYRDQFFEVLANIRRAPSCVLRC